MFIVSKSSEECIGSRIIFKEKILTMMDDLYQVVTITKTRGIWIDDDIAVQVNEFESEEAAREYME